MNTETYDQARSDALARWWWPGQWLRIVWSVWVDQKWYWQNVYPRLENRRRGWGIFVQTWFGAALIALCLLVILDINVGGLDIEEFPNWLIIALLALVFFVMILGGAVKGVPFTAVLIVSVVVYRAFSHISSASWLVYCVLCFVLGFAYGVFCTVSEGYLKRLDIILGGSFIYLWVFDIVFPVALNRFLLSLSKFALAYILGGAGIYAGLRWARRDLPEEIAERLKKRGKADE